ISFLVFMIAIFAETNRLPFDLPEAEQELAGGYNTEYSSMKFALYFLGEYAAMITGSAVVVTLFFGGWHFPGIPDGSRGWIFGLINIAVFFTKVALVIFLFLWVRWTVPRFRWDQLMRLGWLFFFEIALVNIFVVAGLMAWLPKKRRKPNGENQKKTERRKPKSPPTAQTCRVFVFRYLFVIRPSSFIILIMAVTVPRPKLNWREQLYLPAIVSGLAITFKHLKNMLLGHTKVTMQYPEQKWDSHLPDYYRGAPALVRDTDGRVR